MNAHGFLAAIVDPGSYASWDTAPKQPADADPAYLAQLAAAAVRAGTDESVLTGEATVGGRRVALVVSEFGFLAGSVGAAAATRVVEAVERATAQRLPLVAAPASGGTRMQEGTPAFVRMAAIAAALRAHKDAGLLYATYLRHPTTGGVMASWGSLGQIRYAEPGALLGFLGPKVFRALHGRDFPSGVQTAENLHAVGLLDRVCTADGFRRELRRALDLLAPPGGAGRAVPTAPTVARPVPDAWASVCATRDPSRPGLAELLGAAASEVLPLSGTGAGERDTSVLVALARIAGTPCLVVGQDRAAQAAGSLLGPAGLRQARRGLRLAAQLRIPVLTVVDTPGAALSPAAEEGGLAAEIARCLEALGTHPSPTISLLLGQGCGGGALALLPARRVLATSQAWLAPLPPEGASAIRHGTVDHAAAMARSQRITAAELHAEGIVHRVVDEDPDLLGAVAAALAEELLQAG